MNRPTTPAWRKAKRRRLIIRSLVVLGIAAAFALVAYWAYHKSITPKQTPDVSGCCETGRLSSDFSTCEIGVEEIWLHMSLWLSAFALLLGITLAASNAIARYVLKLQRCENISCPCPDHKSEDPLDNVYLVAIGCIMVCTVLMLSNSSALLS